MTEGEARAWLRSEQNVSRETREKLEQFIVLLRDEMSRQNLISKSSADHIWTRHIVDSAQLLRFAPVTRGVWLDLGTGAGFPGIVAAILSNHELVMVESRTRRVDFLRSAIEKLELKGNARIVGSRLEKIDAFPVEIISARAFAPLERLIALSHRFSTEKTVWLLPKGKNAVRELEALPPKQRKMFHVEHSLTDPEARILVGKGKIV